MLSHLHIVLCTPKFPENVGMAARACANYGCPNLVVVRPQLWNMDVSLALATPKGADVMRRVRVEDSLSAALADCTAVYATTARTGGWRRGVSPLRRAAPRIGEDLAVAAADGGQGGVAVVFGAEDRGLTNEEVEVCGRLITIPTAVESTSLNLAQAVLLVLYETFQAVQDKPFRIAGARDSRPATHQEQETLFAILQETLLAIDFLKPDNPDYWMLPVRRFMQRVALKRHEFNLLMGVCRQILWLAGRKGTDGK